MMILLAQNTHWRIRKVFENFEPQLRNLPSEIEDYLLERNRFRLPWKCIDENEIELSDSAQKQHHRQL